MSTVVYKDGIMACDSLMALGDQLMSGIVKAGRTKKYLFGYAGRASHMNSMYDWVRECESLKDLPTPEFFYRKNDDLISIGDVGAAMLVNKKGEIWEVTSEGFTVPIPRTSHAMGHGSEYALGALSMGATALEALEVAATHDAYTGGTFHTFKFEAGESEILIRPNTIRS